MTIAILHWCGFIMMSASLGTLIALPIADRMVIRMWRAADLLPPSFWQRQRLLICIGLWYLAVGIVLCQVRP